MRVTDKYIFFWDSIYSNWYGCEFSSAGRKFNCSEQNFMYHKALTFGDVETAEKMMKESHPRVQKKLGKLVKNYDDTTWAEVRYDIMKEAVYLKFSQNKELLSELLKTGDKIFVEASPYDTIWGIGMGEDDDLILDEKNWKGLNLLGKALCEVRAQFIKELEDEIKYFNRKNNETDTN
jgi:hypothetical protein